MNRFHSFCLSKGQASLSLPSEMDEHDILDLRGWISICERQAERHCKEGLRGRVLKAVHDCLYRTRLGQLEIRSKMEKAGGS